MKDRLIRLLRWSERYTKTDMVYLASGGSWLVLGQITASGAAFLLSIAYANLLPKEAYGSYKYVLSVVSILTVFTLPGISTAYFRSVGRGEEGGFFSLFKTRIRWGFIGTFGALVVAGYYGFMGNDALALCFLVTAAFLPFMDSFVFYDSLLQGRKRFDLAIRYNLIEQGVATVAILVALWFSPTLLTLVGTYLLAWTASRGAIFFYIVRTAKFIGPVNPWTARYGKHLSLIKLINTVAGSLGAIVLFHVTGGTGLAIYSFALAPIEQVRSMLGYAQNLLTPKIAQDTWTPGRFGTFFHKLTPFILVLIAGSLTYVFLAPWFFRIVFPSYLDAIWYSQILAPTLILSGINIVLSTVLQAKGDVRGLHYVNITTTVSTLVFAVGGAYFFGVLGLATAGYFAKSTEFLTSSYLIFARRNASASKIRANGTSENQ
jgi:O-antigen/teichoic acid export membrane protein